MFSKCRVINGEYIVKISRGIVEVDPNSCHSKMMTLCTNVKQSINPILSASSMFILKLIFYFVFGKRNDHNRQVLYL